MNTSAFWPGEILARGELLRVEDVRGHEYVHRVGAVLLLMVDHDPDLLREVHDRKRVPGDPVGALEEGVLVGGVHDVVGERGPRREGGLPAAAAAFPLMDEGRVASEEIPRKNLAGGRFRLLRGHRDQGHGGAASLFVAEPEEGRHGFYGFRFTHLLKSRVREGFARNPPSRTRGFKKRPPLHRCREGPNAI